MKIRNNSVILVFLLMSLTLAVVGCKESQKSEKKSVELPPIQLDKTVGDLAEFVAFNSIPVKGIGLVVGLAGTGSSECPPATRSYLRQYILAQVGQKRIVNPDKMINSKDTAVVLVEGRIPAGAVKQETFDLKVTAFPGTQTTSLANGRLYTTDLKFVGRFEDTITSTRTLALAAGPIYIDSIDQPNADLRTGYVLGGGKVTQDYQILLSLLKPDFRVAAAIRNRINERFGRDVAIATSENSIYLNLPDDYKDKKIRFMELVRALQISTSAAAEQHQISWLIQKLQTEPDKEKYETSLEALGRPVAEKLLPLLESNDISTRFSAARCLLNIGDDRALKYLREFALDPNSPYRIAAIEAIGDTASRRDVISLMSRLVRDSDFKVRYGAYKYLLKYNDPSVIRTAVADDFYVDQVIQMCPPTIFVSRRSEPRIVLFGAPIECEDDIFIQSNDGQIIINTLPNEKRVSVLRKHPFTGQPMGPLKTSFNLMEIIKTLGNEPAPEDEKKRPGLGVPYCQIIEILKNMCEKGAVKAEFVAGPISPVMVQQNPAQ